MKFKDFVWPLILVLFLNLSFPNSVFAETTAFDLKVEPTRPRTFLLPPFASLIFPGFDQWWEGQYGYAAAYTGVALGGYGLGLSSRNKTVPLFSEEPRFQALGFQLAMTSGSMSAYQSFRTAVRSRQSQGDFLFLKHDESPTDLLAAPFHFKYFARPTTYLGIPGNLLLSILITKLQGFEPIASNWKVPGISDVFFSGAFSYNAGVGEEAWFRGWIMPVSMHYMGSELASNITTSLLFGAAHYRQGYIPISQTIGGFYLGFLAQQNEWQLGESIFVHTWYDIIAFLLNYAMADSTARSKAVFQLSPISFPF